MHPLVASIVTLLLLCLWPQTTFADGQGSKLDEAIQLWLRGNDRDSLPALAELARQGDPDARVLLSRIEVMDKGPLPFRLALSREEARALFRQTSSDLPFGKRWISLEADAGNALAVALLASHRADVQPDLIETLRDLGEAEATDHPTRVAALYGGNVIRSRLLAPGAVTDELYPFVEYLSIAAEPRGDGLAALRHIARSLTAEPVTRDGETMGMASLLALGYGFGDTSRGNQWRGTVEDWLMTTPATRPIARMCAAKCGDEARSCAFALFALTGGYYEAIQLDSPVESVIPQSVFLDSPRARRMALRRAALMRNETAGLLATRDEIAEISSCAADLVQNERMATE